jgi:two-component system, NarL family, uhpT operon response regulator UhpA
MNTPAVRIAIVDDHQMVLAGLRAWLEAATSDVTVAITVSNWPDLLLHPDFPVDVALLDIDLGDGIPASLKIAMLRSSGVAVVVISTLADPTHVRECVAAGALGYVPKSEPADEIINAVRAAARGDAYMTSALAEMLVASEDAEGVRASRAPALTPQELRVLVLYASGLPMKSVARRLGISYDTAKGYIDQVREKYALAGREARTKLDLRQRAAQDGLLASDEQSR